MMRFDVNLFFFFLRSNNQMDKRAHHNALERKRRDHIKDSFTGLRDAIPTMRGGDKSSRAQILKKASEYIQVYIVLILNSVKLNHIFRTNSPAQLNGRTFLCFFVFHHNLIKIGDIVFLHVYTI